MLICKRLLNAHSFFYFENFHCVMKLSCFNFCSIYPRNAINVFSDFYTCLSLIKSKHSSSVTRKCSLKIMISLCLVLGFWFFCLPSFCIYADGMKYCKQGIYLWLLCDTEALQLIIFKLKDSMKLESVRCCLLSFVSWSF